VKCQRCGQTILVNERHEYLGETLCEDCYIDVRYPARSCNPWAVYSATRSRKRMGLKGSEGLTKLQKAIYDYVRGRGKVTKEQLIENFGFNEADLQTQLATLRHCELIKGYKESGRIYLAPFD
jgi:late competence protein required for DNA uptake (superfamily II DNA/RNA helicase)